MYKELKKIYDEVGISMFVMATSYLIDIGTRQAKELTEEQINSVEMESGSFMTTEYMQNLMRTTKKIAEVCQHNTIEIIQFCMVEKIIDTKGYKLRERR